MPSAKLHYIYIYRVVSGWAGSCSSRVFSFVSEQKESRQDTSCSRLSWKKNSCSEKHFVYTNNFHVSISVWQCLEVSNIPIVFKSSRLCSNCSQKLDEFLLARARKIFETAFTLWFWSAVVFRIFSWIETGFRSPWASTYWLAVLLL